jgi:hypothetical protein
VTEVELPHSKSLIRTSLNSFFGSTDAHQDLTSKLLRMKEVVSSEVHLFQALGTRNKDSDLLKRKRLLYLFVRDLLDGVSGEVFSNKENRETVLTLKTTQVTWESKLISLMLIFLMIFGMLFYVYLFAMTQTRARQSAWFQSFVMWIFFEIFFSSTGLVIFFHIMIPLSVFTEVAKVKEKVAQDLMTHARRHMTDRRRVSKEVPQEFQSPAGTSTSFNSAKYFFPSRKMASLFPEFPESQLILQFSTPWPKKGSVGGKMELSREYDQAVILSALSRVLIYFLTTLLRFHTLVQDIFIQISSDSGIGYLCLLFIRLYQFNSYLLLVTVLVFLFTLHFLLTAFCPPMKLKSSSSLPSSVDDNDNDNDSDEAISLRVYDEEIGQRRSCRRGSGAALSTRTGIGVESPYQLLTSLSLSHSPSLPPPGYSLSRMSPPLEINCVSSTTAFTNPLPRDHSPSPSSSAHSDVDCSFSTLDDSDDDVWKVTWGDKETVVAPSTEQQEGQWEREQEGEGEGSFSWQDDSSSGLQSSSSPLQSNSNSETHSDSDSTDNSSSRVSEVMDSEEFENPFEDFDLLVLKQSPPCISSQIQLPDMGMELRK